MSEMIESSLRSISLSGNTYATASDQKFVRFLCPNSKGDPFLRITHPFLRRAVSKAARVEGSVRGTDEAKADGLKRIRDLRYPSRMFQALGKVFRQVRASRDSKGFWGHHPS